MPRLSDRIIRLSAPHKLTARFVVLFSFLLFPCLAHAAGDAEFSGKLNAELIANSDDTDQVVFKPVNDVSKVKFAEPLEKDAKVTGGRLYHPVQDKSSLLSLLVESEGETPVLYVDLNQDRTLGADERFELKRTEENNPYMLEATLKLLMPPGLPFQTFPLYVQYFKNVQWDDMQEGERLIMQSKTAFAKGVVDIQGQKTLVQYSFNPQSKKISAQNGTLGVDGNGDGEIDMDRLSPEAAEATEETVIFRAGDSFVSTKRVDLEKNLITMRAHSASDYKRTELVVGGTLPDFNFTDFEGKKRKFSDYKGKYVLLDFWALWCGPCRREMPYLQAAYKRFQDRDFEIVGMNNDQDISPVKDWLKRSSISWTQATPDTIRSLERSYRIDRYPTTILVGPDGKIISLNGRKGNQPSLRGESLLKTLDKLLPL